MVKVEEIPPGKVRDVYQEYLKLIDNSPVRVAQMILFVGDPECDKISWCPPCRKSHPDFMKAAEAYTGKLTQMYIFPIGPKDQWTEMNVFKMFYPYLEGVPTVEVYIRYPVEDYIRRRKFGRLLSPRFNNFMHLLNEYIPEKIAELG